LKFVHEEPDFGALVRTVAAEVGIAPALVEKDYWVTHTLWAIHQQNLEVWFKGGTSLSKGFGLIQRFSEDLDLRIEAGTAKGLPEVRSWTSSNKGPIAQRRAFYEVLGTVLAVSGAKVVPNPGSVDRLARSIEIRIEYPGAFLEQLGLMRPFVLLEVGAARVTPFVVRALSNFVHDWLEKTGQLAGYRDNRPGGVRCVHPMVTLLEKLDAISRRFARTPMVPATFVRHYEDAAAIIASKSLLPLEGMTVRELAEEMTEKKQIVAVPRSDDPAFGIASSDALAVLRRAHGALSAMYWGPRRTVEACCDLIRQWADQSAA
jgi:hypothetical protein